MTAAEQRDTGSGAMFLLFLVFLVLKLTGVIAWSWWWVTAPLWGPVALVAVILLVGVFVATVAHFRSKRKPKQTVNNYYFR